MVAFTDSVLRTPYPLLLYPSVRAHGTASYFFESEITTMSTSPDLRTIIAREVIRSRVNDWTRRVLPWVASVFLVILIASVSIFAWKAWRSLPPPPPPSPPSPPPPSASSASPRPSSSSVKRKRKEPPPEVIRTLSALCDRVASSSEDEGAGDALLAMGEIYRTGAFPRFSPNDEAAETCFKTCARKFGGRIAAMGQVKHMECLRRPVADVDRTGIVLIGTYARRASSFAASRRRRRNGDDSERPRMPTIFHHTPQPQPQPQPQPATTEEDRQLVAEMMRGEGGTEEDEEHARAAFMATLWDADADEGVRRIHVVDVPHVRADAQNVHDHGVTAAVARNLRHMSDSRNEEEEDPIREVAHHVGSCPGLSRDDKEDARRVLDGLNGDNVHSMYGVTERDALASVWSQIQASPHRENLVETLGKQLASGVEFGDVVCSSGKIARIVGTLDGVHNQHTARPMDVVRQEIAGMAVVIRNEVGDEGDEEEMRERLRRRAHAEYVGRMGQNEAVVMPLVEEFCAGF